MKLQMVDLVTQYGRFKDEILAEIGRVLDTATFINGPQVAELARWTEGYLGCKRAIPCGSGTDALQLALMALGVGPGDEVITTPFTFVATAETIAILGATPVYVDIDPVTFNLDPALIPAAITSRTRAIIPVHLYGQPADLDPIFAIADAHGIPVIEDNAQALGADYKGKKIGALGRVGCISFFPSKNLGAYGDGGMVVTDDEALAEQIAVIANHGSKVRYHHDLVGVNSRLDTMQAAVLKVKAPHLDGFNARRREAARAYTERLADVPGITTPAEAPYATHVFHQYTLRSTQRDRLARHLTTAGIPHMIYYPVPLHLQPAFRRDGIGPGSFPETERAAAEVISLPMHPELTTEQIDRIVHPIRAFATAEVGS